MPELGISAFFPAPPLPLLAAELVSLNLEGSGTITPFNYFGLIWSIDNIPVNYGYRLGALNEYYERLAQLVPIGSTLLGGMDVPTEIIDIHTTYGFTRFTESLLTRLLYDVSPGPRLTVYGLKLL